MAAKEVGGRSKQWIYWWRTPNVDHAPWGKLRAHLIASTGQAISLDSSTRSPAVWDEVDRFFGLGLVLQ